MTTIEFVTPKGERVTLKVADRMQERRLLRYLSRKRLRVVRLERVDELGDVKGRQLIAEMEQNSAIRQYENIRPFSDQTKAMKKHMIRSPFKACPHCEEYQMFKSYYPVQIGWHYWCYVCGWKELSVGALNRMSKEELRELVKSELEVVRKERREENEHLHSEGSGIASGA